MGGDRRGSSKTVAVDHKLLHLETQQSASDARIDALEERLHTQHQRLIMLQLQAEDSENMCRKNNVSIRGILQATVGSGLRETVPSLTSYPLTPWLNWTTCIGLPLLANLPKLTLGRFVPATSFQNKDILRAA